MYVWKLSVKNRKRLVATSLQSSKRSFLKIQNFKFAYSALLLFYSLFRLKSLHRVVYMKSVKEWEEISCTSLQSSRSSFCKIQIFKFAYSALPLFYSLFRLKSSLHQVVYMKSIKEWEEISCTSLQSSRSSFRKIQIFNLHILHLRCFIPCLGYRTEESDCCDTGYVRFSTWLFFLFRFVLQNTVSHDVTLD